MGRQKAKEPPGDVIYDTLTVDGKTIRCGEVAVEGLINPKPRRGGPLRSILNAGLRFTCLLMRIVAIYVELLSAFAEFVKRGNLVAVGLFQLSMTIRRYADEVYPLTTH